MFSSVGFSTLGTALGFSVGGSTLGGGTGDGSTLGGGTGVGVGEVVPISILGGLIFGEGVVVLFGSLGVGVLRDVTAWPKISASCSRASCLCCRFFLSGFLGCTPRNSGSGGVWGQCTMCRFREGPRSLAFPAYCAQLTSLSF